VGGWIDHKIVDLGVARGGGEGSSWAWKIRTAMGGFGGRAGGGMGEKN